MSDSAEQGTLSRSEDGPGAGAEPRGAFLFLVLESHAPLAAPARVALDAFLHVLIGRGGSRAVERSGERGLSIRVADPWMSSSHARLTRVQGRWVLEDAGSKNGSLVNGETVSGAPLVDGAVLEIGRTFFLFQEGLAADVDAPPVLDAASLRPPAPGLATLLPGLAGAFARAAAIARSTVPVLIEGETGTGKEVAARAIHATSGRTGAFVAVNCGALPSALVEGQLFGHRRGAFSGATEDHLGFVRSAERGTLFLDELGDLPAPSQAALLRVLQEREVVPLGSARPVPVDFRLIAATQRPIDDLVRGGELRADLSARVAGYRLELPPLRARRADLGLIAGTLLERVAPGRAGGVRLHPRAARALLRHAWPGNVRELEQALAAAVTLGTDIIDLTHLPAALATDEARAGEAPAAEAPGRDELVLLLREHRGNVSAMARALGKARMQVQRWLRRHALDPARFRG